MTPGDLVAILDRMPAADPPGLRILLDLDRVESFEDAIGKQLADLIARQDEIEAAIELLEGYNNDVRQVIHRCSRITPIPSRRLVPGF